MDKYAKIISTLLHVWYPVEVCLHADNDWGRPILLGASSGEESMPVLWGGYGKRVPRDPPSEPSRRRFDRTVGAGAGVGPVLLGIFPKDVGVNRISDPGLQCGGNK